ncbi:MAG: hypothetical protein U0941_25150 [Planctomycetaceae bacterium]
MRRIGYCFAAITMMFVGRDENVLAGVRYVYVQAQPAQQPQGLDGVEKVIRDMAALRPGTASRSVVSDSYHQDLDARLKALEAKNKVASRSIAPIAAPLVTEVAVAAAVDILNALKINKNSSDQDKAQAILQAIIPHIQSAQNSATPANPTPAIPGVTPTEVEFVLALKGFRTAVENAQKDAEKRKEFQDAQKKALNDLIDALKKINP